MGGARGAGGGHPLGRLGRVEVGLLHQPLRQVLEDQERVVAGDLALQLLTLADQVVSVDAQEQEVLSATQENGERRLAQQRVGGDLLGDADRLREGLGGDALLGGVGRCVERGGTAHRAGADEESATVETTARIRRAVAVVGAHRRSPRSQCPRANVLR